MYRRQGHVGSLDWDGSLDPEPRLLFQDDPFGPLLGQGLPPELFSFLDGLRPRHKPDSGFWSSSLRRDGSTAWSGFLGYKTRKEKAGLGVFEFTVCGRPRILRLSSDEDIGNAARALGVGRAGKMQTTFAREFWEAVSPAYDAVRVPEDFERSGLLHYWDVESTVWVRPAEFLRLTAIRPLVLPEKRRGSGAAARRDVACAPGTDTDGHALCWRNAVTWLPEMPASDRAVVFAALMHSVHGDDVTMTAELSARAEAMLDDLDASVNTGAVVSFAPPMPPHEVSAVWASFWAAFRDVHAPQDNLTPEAWGYLDGLMEVLSEDDEMARHLGSEPAVGFSV